MTRMDRQPRKNTYRGGFAELLFCHIVNVVEKGLQVGYDGGQI